MDEFNEKFRVCWNFPVAVTRDNLKDRQADNLSLMNGTISRAQGMRNLGLKPGKMKREIKEEMDEMPAMGNGLAAMNPSIADSREARRPTLRMEAERIRETIPFTGHNDSRGLHDPAIRDPFLHG